MFVLLIALGIFKLGMHVYVPFINRGVLEGFTEQGGMFSVMNTFTGGALSTFSIFAVGIMPYITASIIVQLLQMDVVPKFVEWKEQGEYGQRKLKQTTYVLTFLFALIQSVGMTFSFNQMYAGLIANTSWWALVTIIGTLTLGTVILVVMGEIIEKKGIGKGISIIILAGILMTIPEIATKFFLTEFTGDDTFLVIIKAVLIVAFIYALLVSIIIVNGGERKIPIQSSNVGKYGTASRGTNFLPIKINSAGVIPVIFASALFMLPITFAQMFGANKLTVFFEKYVSFTSVTGILLYALIIMMFTFFYAFVQIDPQKLADNLHMNGSFVPGIRPGKNTVEYFARVLVRLTCVGAVFLALVAVLPMLLGLGVTIPQELTMIGTSLIIVVSVVVDLNNQLQTEMLKSVYTQMRTNKGSTIWN